MKPLGLIITNNIEFSKKYIFELPSGSWTVADRYSYSYYGIITKGYRLLKIIYENLFYNIIYALILVSRTKLILDFV